MPKANKTRQRSRSSVNFSYFDLNNCVEIAQAVASLGSGEVSWDQVAKHIGMDPYSGGFRIRILSAKTFGLVNYGQSQVVLTDLGKNLVNPATEKRARVEALLSVSLFAYLFLTLRDQPLPTTTALDQMIEDLGVSPKQREKARQVFYRSAKQAGLFNATEDRLTLPEGLQDMPLPEPGTFTAKKSSKKSRSTAVLGTGKRRSAGRPLGSTNQASATASSAGDAGSAGSPSLGFSSNHAVAHPFIRGLLDKLPKPETQWTLDDRAKWLTTAASVFDLMYSSQDPQSTQNSRQYVWVEVKGGGY